MRHTMGLCVVLIGLAGCVNPQARGKSPEDIEREKDLDVLTIGDVTEVAGVQAIQVSGVGLVTGLDGSGGSPQGSYRAMLERQLRLAKVENVKAILDSPHNAMVLVSALLPVGARKGETLDVQVILPPGSSAASLRGGYLQSCALSNYELTKNLNPDSQRANTPVKGHVLAHARGSLLVGLGADDEPAEFKKARIWAGGVSHIDFPLKFVLKKDAKYAKVANKVAERINFMFQDDVKKQQEVWRNKHLLLLDEVTGQLNHKFEEAGPSKVTARAISKDVIWLNVPYAYRLNAERYVRVARLTPVQETAEQRGRYRGRLKKMLREPADTIRAALRLEALGKESIATLKEGLTDPHPLVRFASAEALTYLGSTAGCQELGRLAERHTDLQALCLKTLASHNEASNKETLVRLLDSPKPPLRCGAFRALRWMREPETSPIQRPGDEPAFHIHRVAPHAPPLVNFALSQRAEITLYGGNLVLLSPVKIRSGKVPDAFTVTAEPGDDRCTISRFLAREDRVLTLQSTLRLEDVLRTMAELGAQYPDVVDFLRKVGDYGCLSCRVTFDSQPEEVSPEQLVENARDPYYLKEPAPEDQPPPPPVTR